MSYSYREYVRLYVKTHYPEEYQKAMDTTKAQKSDCPICQFEQEQQMKPVESSGDVHYPLDSNRNVLMCTTSPQKSPIVNRCLPIGGDQPILGDGVEFKWGMEVHCGSAKYPQIFNVNYNEYDLDGISRQPAIRSKKTLKRIPLHRLFSTRLNLLRHNALNHLRNAIMLLEWSRDNLQAIGEIPVYGKIGSADAILAFDNTESISEALGKLYHAEEQASRSWGMEKKKPEPIKLTTGQAYSIIFGDCKDQKDSDGKLLIDPERFTHDPNAYKTTGDIVISPVHPFLPTAPTQVCPDCKGTGEITLLTSTVKCKNAQYHAPATPLSVGYDDPGNP